MHIIRWFVVGALGLHGGCCLCNAVFLEFFFLAADSVQFSAKSDAIVFGFVDSAVSIMQIMAKMVFIACSNYIACVPNWLGMCARVFFLSPL